MQFKVQNLSCGYGDYAVQKYINFTLESGEILCVLGPNGSGKSTLFRSLIGLQPPLDGQVFIDNSNISKWSQRKRSSHIAYVSQRATTNFPYRVSEIVELGRLNRIGIAGQPTDADFLAAEQAMSDLGIYHLRDCLYTDISGGELQMVMIARALTQRPKMLILDEPTAALDYGNAVRVLKCIHELAERGYSVLMSTHSPDHAFMCEADVLLLRKDAPMVHGSCTDVITDKYMKQCYGVNIKIVEFVNEKGKVVRRCAPVL